MVSRIRIYLPRKVASCLTAAWLGAQLWESCLGGEALELSTCVQSYPQLYPPFLSGEEKLSTGRATFPQSAH